MAGRYCEGKIKMASEKVSRKMVLEIKYVNAKIKKKFKKLKKLKVNVQATDEGVIPETSRFLSLWNMSTF